LRIASFVTMSIIMFSCTQAYAAGSFLDLSPEQLLSAEVISVSKKAEPVSHAPAAVYVITQEDIARTGVRSIPDALRMAPGVNVAQGDSNSWAVNIRGFNKGLANQLLVMIDGRTVYNPLFAGTYWELQNLPLEDIDRIEVVRGPGGTLWGANAVNGVINIITKRAQDTQRALVSMGVGNYEHDFILGQKGGKINEDTYYRTYAQHFNKGSFIAPAGGHANDAWLDSRTGFRIDRSDALTVSGDAYLNRTEQLVSVPQLTAPYAVTRPDSIESSGANLLAHWNKIFDDGAVLSLQSYADYTLRDQLILSDEEDIFDIDALYNFAQYGRHEIAVGGGYRLTHESIGNTPTLSINPASGNANLFNIFAQDKITLSPQWFLTVGSKIEHNDFTGYEIEPNARLQWFPDEAKTVWAAVSRAVRTPSPLESNIDLTAKVFPPGALPLKYNLIANPNFDSEEVIAYELGYRDKITPDVSADVALFYNDYSGLAAQQFQSLTVVTPLLPQYFLFQTTTANLMKAETYGAEIAADWNAADNWKLSGSYSLLKIFIHLNNDFTNQQAEEGQSPQHQLSLRSYWNINKDWSLDTSAYYVDKLSAFDVPAYVRVDVNVGWRIAEELQFNLIGQNLFENAHREFGNSSDLNAGEVPRTVFGKLTWRF
jgi:iron complex outermembrane receptor protein